MAKNNRIRLPSGMGGLTSYGESTGSLITLSPTHVIVLCGLIIVVLLLLRIGAL